MFAPKYLEWRRKALIGIDLMPSSNFPTRLQTCFPLNPGILGLDFKRELFYSLFMRSQHVRVYASREKLPRQEQLAWKLAQVALDREATISREVQDMVINRFIDNAGVAMAAINRDPVKNARSQALAHPAHPCSLAGPRQEPSGPQQQLGGGGARLFGLQGASHFFESSWAAWANGVAVRELDFHDTFLAADYSHPGDNIPPILAVAQQKNCNGKGSPSGHCVGLRNSNEFGQGYMPS